MPALVACACAAVAFVATRPAPARAPEAVFGSARARPAGGALVPAMRLGNSDYCGACHTDIFQQWSGSAHHFSSFNNPFYRHVALGVRDRRGVDALKLCAGCHDPLPLLAGEMDQLDLGAWSANAGITCLACHRISSVHGPNGDYRLSTPTLDAFALTDNALLRPLHSAFVRAVPAAHRAELSRALHRTPEYCGTCHAVVSPKQLNGVVDFTVQDEYGHWRASRFADPDAPGGRRTCIDCHMPLVPSSDPAARDGLVRSHNFAGGNTALPVLNREDEQLVATERFLKAGAPSLRFTGLRREGRHAVLQLEIDNQRVGHGFPGGTSESNEAWLSVDVRDAAGRRLFSSGDVALEDDLPADVVALRSVFLDRTGRPTDRANTATDAVRAGTERALAAGERRVVRYRFPLDPLARPPLRAGARLNWRKFPPSFTRRVFGGRPVPALPITVLREIDAELVVQPPSDDDEQSAERVQTWPPARGGAVP